MAYRDEVLADSPVAYYRLEETSGSTVADETGNGHTGTVTGSDLNVSGPDNLGSAASHDGTDDHIDVGTLGTLGSSMQTSTWELWARWTITGFESLFGMLSDGSGTAITLWANRDEVADEDPGNILWFMRDEAGDSIFVSPATNPGLNDGEWHHIVVRVVDSATNDVELHIDGASVALTFDTAEGPSNFADFQYPLVLAARNLRGSIDRFCACSTDEVALYDAALSATRIQAHYDAQSGTGAVSGSGGSTAAAATSSGTGTVTVAGSGASTGPAPSTTGSGAVTVSGSGGSTGPAAASSGAGATTASGAGASVGPAATSSGTGSASDVATGSGASAGPSATSTGTGAVTASGAGTSTATPATSAGSGTVTVSGSGGSTIVAPTSDGTGVVTITGSGASIGPAPTSDGNARIGETITPASRTLTVAAEDRTLVVAAETRVLAVAHEDRTLTVKG